MLKVIELFSGIGAQTQTFQEQTYMGRRPRLNLLNLIKEKDYKPFYIYYFKK